MLAIRCRTATFKRAGAGCGVAAQVSGGLRLLRGFGSSGDGTWGVAAEWGPPEGFALPSPEGDDSSFPTHIPVPQCPGGWQGWRPLLRGVPLPWGAEVPLSLLSTPGVVAVGED